MSAKDQDKIARIRRKIADLEATLAGLREQLARLEEGVTVAEAAAADPVLALWKASLPKARERSSKHQCRVMWSRVPKGQRPDLETVVAALETWNRCEQWKKDGGAYVPGLHRWISERRWEDLPKVADPIERYRAPKKPTQATAPVPAEIATEDDIRAILGGFGKRCTPPATSVQDPAGNLSNFSLPCGNPDLGSALSQLPPGTLTPGNP